MEQAQLVISTIDITALAGDAITAMKINRPVGTNNPIAIVGIALDGKLLVDQGVGDLGDTRVEYQTNGGEGTVVSVNTDDKTLLVEPTRATVITAGSRRTKPATDFYVAGPQVVDEPLLTADVELESSIFCHYSLVARTPSRTSSGNSTASLKMQA